MPKPKWRRQAPGMVPGTRVDTPTYEYTNKYMNIPRVQNNLLIECHSTNICSLIFGSNLSSTRRGRFTARPSPLKRASERCWYLTSASP